MTSLIKLFRLMLEFCDEYGKFVADWKLTFLKIASFVRKIKNDRRYFTKGKAACRTSN